MNGVCYLQTPTLSSSSTMTKQLKYLEEFRNQLLQFLDELIEQFPEETDLVIIRIFLKDQISVYDIMGRFIRDVLPFQDEIKCRNESFFLENSFLYVGTCMKKIDHFQNLWKSNRLDEHDKTVIWKWMDVLIHISSKYFNLFGHVPGWETREHLKTD